MGRMLIRLLVIFAVLAAVVLIFASFDEREIRHSTHVNDYVPMPERGAENFEALLDLSHQKIDFSNADFSALREVLRDEIDTAALKEAVLAHREPILASYEAIGSLLPELHDLSDSGLIGDLCISPDSEIIGFSTMRQIVEVLTLHACLTHFDPSLEPNSEDLLALVRLNSNWIENTRALVHSMISIVTLKKSLEAFEHILPYMTEEVLELWLAELERPVDAVTATSNSLWGEYCSIASVIETISKEGGARVPFLFHKNRTLNRFGDHVDSVTKFAEKGDWDGMSAYADTFEDGVDAFPVRRNMIGELLLAMAIPATNQVYRQATESNSTRSELIALVKDRLND